MGERLGSGGVRGRHAGEPFSEWLAWGMTGVAVPLVGDGNFTTCE
jgi:hypothetical protein